MLLDVENRYSLTEKLVLSLVNAKKKLCQYFEFNHIFIYSNHPIRQILAKSNLSGRLTK